MFAGIKIERGSKLEIIDANGKKVYSKENILEKETINCSGFSSGIYFYKISIPIESGKETLQGKFVKE